MKKSVLSIDTNAKTVKGQKYGYMTGILYLAPNTVSGRGTTCPNSTIAQCDKACLYSSGRGKFTNVQQARIEKTHFFFDEFEAFMNVLVKDIAKLVTKAKKSDVIPLVRLNGTSDILWERKSFTVTEQTSEYVKKYHGLDIQVGIYKNIMEVFPNVQFYDYTKIAGRFDYQLPTNYDLTFSYSGVSSYQRQVQHAISKGSRIAVVFRNKENIPTEFMGMKVVDGDNSDIRHIEPQGVIVGLYAKGDAKKDTTGFVVGE